MTVEPTTETPETTETDVRTRTSRPDEAALGATWPDLPTFLDLAASRRIVPVVRRLLADAETPVGVYRKLAKDRAG